jgi:ABC-2 type transport system ATP-binding protein
LQYVCFSGDGLAFFEGKNKSMTCAAVEIEKLTKIFNLPAGRVFRLLRRSGTEEVTALRGVDLTIEEGEIFGLVGRNGQGKTTLIKSIAALLVPTSGRVRVFGVDSNREDWRVKRKIGLVSSEERSFYWRLTGWQNMLFFARLHGMDEVTARRRIGELFEMFDLAGAGDRAFHEFSSGIKQRFAIARALLHDPPLLLLDEPTRSLDPIAADELRVLIRDRISRSEGRTVMITSHNLVEVETLCSRVAILSRGVVRECAPLEALRTKYSGREEVTICLRVPPAGDLADRLGETAADLVWDQAAEGGATIRFTCRRLDGTLHSVLSRILAAGGEVTSCDTKRLGLQEIMEEIEKQV